LTPYQTGVFIPVTHTRLDHVLDVPYIASKTGALVIGAESTANFARDKGLPNSRILTVKGGEDLELGSDSGRFVLGSGKPHPGGHP